MSSLIYWGLKLRKTSILWWSFGLMVFVAVELAFYPSLHSHAEELNKTFSQLPEAVRNLIGGSDYVSPAGYLNGRVFYLVLPIMLSIIAITLGGSLVGKEEESGTLELVLSTPISRGQVLWQKAVLGMITLGAISLSSLISVIVVAWIVRLEMPVANLFLATLGAYLLALATGGLAFALTAIGGRFKSAAIGLASAWALGGYVVASLVPNFNWLRLPARFFAFYYYRPEQLLRPTPTIWPLGVLLVLIGLFGFVAWFGFRTRDLRK